MSELEAKIADSIRGVSELRRENADVRAYNEKLAADLAQASSRNEFLEKRNIALEAERGYYMRHSVALLERLTSFATHLNSMAEQITAGVDEAKLEGYRPNGAAPTAELEQAPSAVIPDFLRLDHIEEQR